MTSICYRICSIFIGSYSIFLKINNIHAIGRNVIDSIAFFLSLIKREILPINFEEKKFTKVKLVLISLGISNFLLEINESTY